jgi:O-antigen ligase
MKVCTNAPEHPPRELVSPDGLWAVGIIVVVLAGIFAGALGPAGVAAVAAVAIAALAAVRWPGVVFAAYLLLPWYKGFANPYVPVDLTVALAVVNGAQVIWIVQGGWRHLRRDSLIVWLSLTLVVVAGVAWAPGLDESVPRAVQWVALIVLPSFAAVRIASDPRYVRETVATIAGLGILVLALAIPRIGGAARLVVLEQNTIQVAIAALFVPMIAVAYAGMRRRLVGLALAIVVPLSLIVAVASGSRGPPLAASATAIGAFGVHLARGGKVDRRAVVLTVGVGVGVAIAFLAIGTLPEAATLRFSALGEYVLDPAGATVDTSAGVRVDLFGAALRMFAERPIIGNGTGSFASFAAGTVGLTDLPYPHNIVLQVGADFGLLGLGLVALLVASALFRRIPADPSWVAVRLLFAFLFLESLVSGDFYSDRMLWALLVLLVLAPSPDPRRSTEQHG